jgi:hypothetical protein
MSNSAVFFVTARVAALSLLFVGWVERSETPALAGSMGFTHSAQPILQNSYLPFLRSRDIRAPGFFSFSFLRSQLPIPDPRGWRSAGRRYPLSCRARNRATPRLRSVGRPAQPGRRLAALHRDSFGPAPRSAPELPPASFARATPAAGIASGLPRVPNLPATVLRPAPGRHLPLRLQETPLENAPHERDVRSLSTGASCGQMHIVVDHVVAISDRRLVAAVRQPAHRS